jgi:hypothetical protein
MLCKEGLQGWRVVDFLWKYEQHPFRVPGSNPPSARHTQLKANHFLCRLIDFVQVITSKRVYIYRKMGQRSEPIVGERFHYSMDLWRIV